MCVCVRVCVCMCGERERERKRKEQEQGSRGRRGGRGKGELGKMKVESMLQTTRFGLEANLWKYNYRNETMTAIISLIVIFNI